MQQRGRRCAGAHFVVFSQLRGGDGSRLGITVSRRVGTAVVRDRLKRRVREFFRKRPPWAPSTDTVVIARPGAGALDYGAVSAELDSLFTRVLKGSQRASSP